MKAGSQVTHFFVLFVLVSFEFEIIPVSFTNPSFAAPSMAKAKLRVRRCVQLSLKFKLVICLTHPIRT